MLSTIDEAREALELRYDVLLCARAALSECERHELREIEQALERIRRHEFGW